MTPARAGRAVTGAFALGFTALLAQVVLVREFASLFQGNELTAGLVLASWLLWVGLGSLAASRLSGLPGFAARPALAGLQAAAGLLVPLTVLAARLVPSLSGAVTGETMPLATVLLAVAFIPAPLCLALGLQFPLLAEKMLAERMLSDPLGGPGRVYLLESLGGAAAGFLFAFLLAGRVPGLALALLLAAAGTALGAATLAPRRPAAAAAAAFALLAAAVLATSPALERLTRAWRWPGFAVAASRETPHGTITATRLGAQVNIFENGLFSFAIPDPEGAEEAVHLPLAVHGQASRILVLGGAAAGIPAEILKHPVSAVDFVELDPGLVDLARTFLTPADASALADPRVTLRFGDPRALVRDSPPGGYDLVLLFLPEPENALVNRCYTLEFFRLVRRILKPDGLISFGLASSPNYLGGELLRRNASIRNTLAAVFPSVAVSPLERNIFFASPAPGGIDLDADLIRERLQPLDARLLFFKPEVAAARLPRERTRDINQALAAEADAPLNRDGRPMAHLLSLGLWVDLLLGPGRMPRGLITLLKPWLAAGALVLALAVLGQALLLPGPRARRWSAGFTMAATGFACLALEVSLLYAFQVSQGFLFRDLGALLALVMLGLAAGSLVGRSAAVRGRERPLLIAAELAFLALAAAGSLALGRGSLGILTGPAGRWAFHLLAFLLGVTGGAQFPLLAARMGGESGGGKGAGLAYGLDLLGSCLGAALVAALVIPLAGLAGAFLLVAGAKGLSLLLCLLERGGRGAERGAE